MIPFNFSIYNCLCHNAGSCDARNGQSESHYDKLSYEKETKNDVNQSPVIWPENYGGNNISCVFDDPKYSTLNYPGQPSS